MAQDIQPQIFISYWLDNKGLSPFASPPATEELLPASGSIPAVVHSINGR